MYVEQEAVKNNTQESRGDVGGGNGQSLRVNPAGAAGMPLSGQKEPIRQSRAAGRKAAFHAAQDPLSMMHKYVKSTADHKATSKMQQHEHERLLQERRRNQTAQLHDERARRERDARRQMQTLYHVPPLASPGMVRPGTGVSGAAGYSSSQLYSHYHQGESQQVSNARAREPQDDVYNHYGNVRSATALPSQFHAESNSSSSDTDIEDIRRKKSRKSHKQHKETSHNGRKSKKHRKDRKHKRSTHKLKC